MVKTSANALVSVEYLYYVSFYHEPSLCSSGMGSQEDWSCHANIPPKTVKFLESQLDLKFA